MHGRVAAVTGAARGIGRALAHGLADAGAAVAVLDRDATGAASVAAEIVAGGGSAFATMIDITDAPACVTVCGAIARTLGPISLLVNNAGILTSATPGSADYLATWRKTFDVNAEGTVAMIEAALPQLKETRGSIVNVSSTSAFTVSTGGTVYAASKAAVAQMTRGLAVELGAFGIRVNAIAPGPVDTGIGAAIGAAANPASGYVARTPLGRIARPEDVVGPVVFLGSDLAAHVSGVVLPVDGGYLATAFIRSDP